MKVRVSITSIVALLALVFVSCGGGQGGSSPNPTGPSAPSGTPAWSTFREVSPLVVTPNPVPRRSFIKIDAFYMVKQSGLAYENVWSIRYPDKHEEELPRQTGTNGVAGVLTTSSIGWNTASSQPLGDYAVILRLTESLNGMSNTITMEMPFTVVQ